MKIAVIGCGSIARFRHACEYKANKDVEIAGFFDFVKSRAEELAKDFGGKAFDSIEEILGDTSIDAVSVCVANAYHAETAIRALKSGKHVLCEKPMAISLEDCQAMVEAAKETGKRLMIGQNQRLTPAHKRAKEIIAKGELGKVLSFNTIFAHGGPESWSVEKSKNTWFFKKSSAAFGSMADLGIHKIDLIRYLIGDEVESAYSTMKVLDKTFEDGTPIEVDDNSVEILNFRNGAFGTVTTSWTSYGCEFNTTNIFCSKGIIKLYSDPEYSLIIVHQDGKVEKFALDQIQTNDNQTSSGVIDEFVQSILANRPSLLDADDVIGSMKAVFACQRSSLSGKAEKV